LAFFFLASSAFLRCAAATAGISKFMAMKLSEAVAWR
jgi:hypothetical protein